MLVLECSDIPEFLQGSIAHLPFLSDSCFSVCYQRKGKTFLIDIEREVPCGHVLFLNLCEPYQDM